MRRALGSWFVATAALLMAAGPALLHAQDDPAQNPGPPQRAVARISVMNGEVSVRRGDSGGWVAAAVNAPLMVDDRVATGAGARAEVQFDSANLIRIGAHAEIRLARLEYGHYNVQIAHGTVTFRVLHESPAQVEIDTPAVSVKPLGIGAYRVYVQADGQVEITDRLGNAEVYTPRGSEQLQAGQTMLVRGNPADPEFRIVPAIAYDEWDRWNEQRDREMLNSQSYQRVPHDIYGSEDLDNSGRWVDVPSYGDVWTPTVGPDWAPYQNGRWVWEDYYGWTWISYDPWGWAPFHYGRWFYASPYGWCWYPGFLGMHYWSPALVAFFGFGPGAGVGFGFGSVGWVPLAPFEPLYPWWGRGLYAGFHNPAYFNRGAAIINANIGNVYRNARAPHAVASVSAVDFQQGRFGRIAPVSAAQIHEAGLVRGPLPVTPTAAALRYSNRMVAGVPRTTGNVRFFSHDRPPAVERVPFAEQQRAMQRFSRQTVVSRGAFESREAVPRAANSGGWRPVNQPPSTAPANRGAGSIAPANRGGGWRRFGEPRPPTPGVGRGYGPVWNPGGPRYRPYNPPSNNRPQSIRVAPPVIRERPAPRSAPRGEGGGHGFRGGGGGSHGGGHR